MNCDFQFRKSYLSRMSEAGLEADGAKYRLKTFSYKTEYDEEKFC